jgi:hypothetical protein
MRLGRQQLDSLMVLGAPSRVLIAPIGKVERSLQRRGLVAPHAGGPSLRITPAGLRALADALEAGELDRLLKPPEQAGG